MATPSPADPPPHIVVIGVAGSGKSLAATRLAAALGLPMVDADDFHPRASIGDIGQGLPLQEHRALAEADQANWLRTLIEQLHARPRGAVLAYPGLKRAQRDSLRNAAPGVRFLHLALTPHQALERAASRTDQFYPPSLVAADCEALEDPAGEAAVRVVDGTQHVDRIVEDAVRWLRPPFNNA